MENFYFISKNKNIFFFNFSFLIEEMDGDD